MGAPLFYLDKLPSNEDAMRQRRQPTVQAMRSFRGRMRGSVDERKVDGQNKVRKQSKDHS